jgi:DNA-directed RNA polymerase specialized sigma24 family protein
MVEGTAYSASKESAMAKSPFQIVLSGEERAELERRVTCYTRPHKVVQRAKMILYAADGLSNAEIARRLETAAEVVGRWRKRFFEQRLAGLEDRERAGRPRRFPPGADRRGEGDRLLAPARARPAAVAFLAG